MPPDPPPDRDLIYRLAFIRNCYILILRGYELIRASDFSQAEETSITGEINGKGWRNAWLCPDGYKSEMAGPTQKWFCRKKRGTESAEGWGSS